MYKISRLKIFWFNDEVFIKIVAEALETRLCFKNTQCWAREKTMFLEDLNRLKKSDYGNI